MVLQRHWENKYRRTPFDQVGWWEESPEASLRLVDRCVLAPDGLIVDAGAGSSTFIESLMERGFCRFAAIDLSAAALATLRERLGAERASRVRWIVDDLTHPAEAAALRDVALWHDRAALHFFVEAADRDAYAAVIRTAVRPGGYVILAAFSLIGATECSDLPVRNYDAAMLGEFLGPEFALIETFDYTYINPSGSPRPFVYVLYQR